MQMLRAPVVAAILLLVSCEAAAPPVSTGAVISASGATDLGADVNRARTARGLAPLAASPALTGAAVAQARHAATVGQLTHRSPGGGTVKDRIEARGFDACLAAENLAARQPDAEAVTTGWMASPGHRSNMLLPQATHYGAGTALTADGTRYWVLALARSC